MKSAAEILAEVRAILSTKWKTRDGIKVPEPENVQLGNDAVKLEGTVLYADMADSTGLVTGFKDWFAAENYKSYLVAACYIIRNNSGVITAFDGDRVMAVYHGDSKNSAAAKSALQINWALEEINKAVRAAFPSTAFQLQHSIGVDTSELFVAKTGIRNSNDLVWVGPAANYAAKLAGAAEFSGGAFITEAVFSRLSSDVKIGGNPPRLMWGPMPWKALNRTVHFSNWTWAPG
jgi:class 3 adenylate cyclase